MRLLLASSKTAMLQESVTLHSLLPVNVTCVRHHSTAVQKQSPCFALTKGAAPLLQDLQSRSLLCRREHMRCLPG